MAKMDDMELLREYAGGGNEQAFTALVARHISMVHSVALRHVRDPQQAEEITLAVFVILARKAGALPGRTILSAWLFHTARLTAANFQRTEIRRARREQEAYMQSGMREDQTNGPWGQMAPLLDEAVASLNETDRNAIVLRFVEGRDFKEVGAALGATEDSGRMRVNRAVEKLRMFLARRGVALSAAVIAGALSANAVQAAPPGLLGSVAVTATKGASTTTTVATLIKGTLSLMALAKLKTAVLTGVGILLAAGTATVAVKVVQTAHTAGVAAKTTWDPALDALFDLYSRSSGQAAQEALSQFISNHPPVALIRPARAQNPGARVTAGTMGINGRRISMGDGLKGVLIYVYDVGATIPPYRIILPPDLDAARFEYVNTMPEGGKEALQRELKDQFGLVARREMREVDALVMTVKRPDATGLKKHPDTPGSGGAELGNAGPGGVTGKNMPMASLAIRLGRLLGGGVKVIDQTGLSGGFDLKLTLPDNASPDDVKQAVLDQLGLELSPAGEKQSVEFLVVEKVK